MTADEAFYVQATLLAFLARRSVTRPWPDRLKPPIPEGMGFL
jgi:hypothetical protein